MLRHEGRALIGDLHDTVACGGLGVLDAPDGGPGTARFTCDHATGVARQAGVMTCHSPLACPVCAPKVAARRAVALIPQVEEHVAEGGTVSLVTLTVRHRRGSSLRELRRGLSKAWKGVTSGKWISALRKVGFVRGFDITWSERNGWHPHLHITLMLGAEHEDADVCEALVSRWRAALAKEGWTTTREAQHYDRADDPVKAARYAVTPAAVYESLSLATKRARGEGSGLTPFEILERAVADKAAAVEGSRWIALWREYVADTKGCKQVATSQGITLEPPEEEADEREQDAVLEAGAEALREMDARGFVAPVLDAIDDHVGDPEGMREAIRAVMAPMISRGWSIPGWNAAAGPGCMRREKDDVDRAAEAIPPMPHERVIQAARERTRARMEGA